MPDSEKDERRREQQSEHVTEGRERERHFSSGFSGQSRSIGTMEADYHRVVPVSRSSSSSSSWSWRAEHAHCCHLVAALCPTAAQTRVARKEIMNKRILTNMCGVF